MHFQVDAAALLDSMEQLSQFGRNQQGAVVRLAYSEADLEARHFVMDLMRQAQLEVRVDAAGNIIGKRAGSSSRLAPITFGSHIDTVPEGGKYDGSLGCLAAIACVHAFEEAKYVTRHPLEVIIFNNEEGGLIGSRAMVGQLHADELLETSQSGVTHRQGITLIGGDPDRLELAKRSSADVAAYLELHVEQGGVLEESATNIGIVEGIVGIQWDRVTIKGRANHAGTTPMNRRQDALLAAAQLVQQVNEVATNRSGSQVATVGELDVRSGAHNIIPGHVILSVELRDLLQKNIEAMSEEIHRRAASIAKASNTQIQFHRVSDNAPAPTEPRLQQHIQNAAHSLGLTVQTLPSGAGHDAQSMQAITSIGMIFVPSVGGISHAPDEFTLDEDMSNGANVLLHTIKRMDANAS